MICYPKLPVFEQRLIFANFILARSRSAVLRTIAQRAQAMPERALVRIEPERFNN